MLFELNLPPCPEANARASHSVWAAAAERHKGAFGKLKLNQRIFLMTASILFACIVYWISAILYKHQVDFLVPYIGFSYAALLLICNGYWGFHSMKRQILMQRHYRNSCLAPASVFFANNRGFHQMYQNDGYEVRCTWKSVLEIRHHPRTGDIILDMGTSFIVLPPEVFADENEQQKFLKAIRKWQYIAHRESRLK